MIDFYTHLSHYGFRLTIRNVNHPQQNSFLNFFYCFRLTIRNVNLGEKLEDSEARLVLD